MHIFHKIWTKSSFFPEISIKLRFVLDIFSELLYTEIRLAGANLLSGGTVRLC